MTKKPRLRVKKEKRGRRLILYFLLAVLLLVAGYSAEEKFKISEHVTAVFTKLKKSFSQDAPNRGTIYDRNLKQIATTMERVAVYARTREIGSIQETAAALGTTLDIDQEKLRQQLESGILRLWIKEDISQEQEEQIKKLQLAGIYLQSEAKRYYPNAYQAAHLIGYVENGIGLSGVEFYYDRLLASRKIKQQEERKPLSSAQDLVLTIDLKIQDILEHLAEEIKKREQAEKVAAYLMEGRTGEIVGGVQLPGFDPNFFARYPQTTLENIFLQSLYLPPKYRKFLCDAAILQVQRKGRAQLLPWSIIETENDLGSQIRLWDRLGLSDEEQVDFQASSEKRREDPEQLEPATPFEEPSLLVPEKTTPLKLLTAYSSLLNNGVEIHPFVVKKIIDPETGAESLVSANSDGGKFSAERESSSISETTRLFRSQAEEGPMGSYFFQDKILLADSTGTNSRYTISEFTYITIPAGENNLNMLVIVQRNPAGVLYKGITPEGIAEIVGDKVARISVLQQVSKTVADVVEPELAGDGNYQEGEQNSVEVQNSKKDLDQKGKIPEIMPDLKGLSLRKSLRLLQGRELKINITGTGRVVSQQPPPGQALEGITECRLVLEKIEDLYPGKVSKRQNKEQE